jgi:hypothetical protein
MSQVVLPGPVRVVPQQWHTELTLNWRAGRGCPLPPALALQSVAVLSGDSRL